MIARAAALAAAILALAACGGGTLPRPPAPQSPAVALRPHAYTASNDLPPRLQWEANFGYCGEVSMIAAGLYYGQYSSQYDARAIASPGIPQNLASSQLLVGNAGAAATRMHLTWVRWNAQGPSSQAFLGWVERNVALGRPVIAGLYNNYDRIYGDPGPYAGSRFYDHVVPISGVSSSRPLTGTYDPHAVVTFSDNGNYGIAADIPYVFRYAFAAFQKSRVQANQPNGPIYSLPSRVRDFGIAITGVADASREALPVRVATNVNYERPSIVNGSSRRPPPMPVVLTVTVSGLKPGVAYRLYRYSSFAAVPGGNYNAHASAAAKRWSFTIASGSTFTITERLASDRVAAYRAAAASAP